MILDRHVIVDEMRLAYRHSAGSSGETIVLLHGTPSHSFIWRNVIPDLEAHGHGVVAHDLLGYGASERPLGADTSVTAQAELLAKLLGYLEVSNFTLVAHDIGGAIAQIVATRRPDQVRRLMLIDTVSYDSWPSATWRAIIRDHLADYAAMPQDEFEALLTRQLAMTVNDPPRMSDETLDAYLAPHRSPLGRASFFEHQVRHYDSRPTEQVAPLLRSLTVPTTIVWGAQDQWQPVGYAERLAGDIPGARLVVVPDAGHFLMEDNPGRVVDEILHLLSDGRARERRPASPPAD